MYLSIPISKAREFVVSAQMLNAKAISNADINTTYEIINRLGYVQIDTISVIQRAHHHVMWTRQNQYHTDHLHDLQSEQRKVFEYWGHAMSYLPMSDYRYSLLRMENFKNPKHKWIKKRYNETKYLFPEILHRIREEGPLGSKDFKHPTDDKRGTWWDWKPAKMALEILYWQGELMITERKNFQKIYDLRERVLPNHIDISRPGESEVAEFLIRKGLQAMGIASLKDLHRFLQPDTARDSDWQAVDRAVITKVLQDLVEEGEVIKIEIDELPHDVFYISNTALQEVQKKSVLNKQVHLLSPFDNLVIQRDRVKKLFDFEYMLECYVPAAKRKYGYFVLPVLWKNNLIGRIDPKADRKTKTMIINNLQIDEDTLSDPEFLEGLSKTFANFMRFNDCERIEIKKSNCKSSVNTIKRGITQALL